MDSFCEQLVIRKNTKKIINIKIIIWVITLLLGALITFAFSYLAFTMGASSLFIIAVVVIALAIYMAIKFSKALNIEFEYAFTNGSFDIDRISAHTNRVRLITAECKDIEEFGKFREMDHEHRTYAKRVHAVSHISAENFYYVTLRQPSIGKVLVVLEPDENSLEHLTKFMPRDVYNSAKRDGKV